MNQHYLFFITQNYSFEILRPLQAKIKEHGGKVLWFVYSKRVTIENFTSDEEYTLDPVSAVDFAALATFVPGNIVPGFLPGLKVQVFHGLEWKKKGHFGIRGYFDLYCTHGPATTNRFNLLAKKHGSFDVIETGWPKLDDLFTSPTYQWKNQQEQQPTILFAPTFSPALTSAPALFDEISRLSREKSWQWLVKFHPKMSSEWIEKYRSLESDSLHIVEESSVANVLQAADVMVSDTSSIIGEFALLNKPAVTLNNSQPGNYLIDITHADKLEGAIESALKPSIELTESIKEYAADLHPYDDGEAAQRVYAATQHMLTNGRAHLKNKPLKLLKNFKMRRSANYWTF